MTKLTCHQAHQDALTRRTQNPLKSGEYKLREGYRTMRNRYEALNLIESSIEENIPFGPYFDIRGWTPEDWPDELCELPIMIAEDLGYRVLPAIRVMCADPSAPADLKDYLASLERQVESCVQRCETYRRQIEKPTKQQTATLKRNSAARHLVTSTLMIIEDTFACAGFPAPNMEAA
jgi:hypothetical protein